MKILTSFFAIAAVFAFMAAVAILAHAAAKYNDDNAFQRMIATIFACCAALAGFLLLEGGGG